MPEPVSTTELTSAQSQHDSEPVSTTAHDDVLLICVNYRKPAETKRFVASAREQSLNSSLRVIVVDNSPFPGEGGVSDSLNGDPQLKAIATGKNLGYFGAAAV